MVQLSSISNSSSFTNTGTSVSTDSMAGVSPGNIIVAMCFTANWSASQTTNITIDEIYPGYTWIPVQSYANNSDAALFIWYHVVDIADTDVSGSVVTFQWPENTGIQWGASVLIFGGTNFISGNALQFGASNISANQIAQGLLPSFNFTTTGNQSLVFLVILDWDAGTHTTRIFSVVNGSGASEAVYTDAPSNYSLLFYYWTNTGVVGTNNYSLQYTSAAAAIESTQAIFEIKNTADEVLPDETSTAPGGRPSLDINGPLNMSFFIQNVTSMSNVSSIIDA